MSEITEFLSRQQWKYRKSGDELETGCPFNECPNKGEKQFYINIHSGSWYCHRCACKGKNLKQLQYKLGLIEEKEPVSESHIYIPDSEILSYQENLLGNKVAMNWLEEVRGIERRAIYFFRLGHKQCLEGNAITFPYFDRSGACVGLKYYFYDRTSKKVAKMRFEKDSKLTVFNIKNINLNEELVITEGELDAITAWQYGRTNCGSVPNGAQGVNGWVEDIAEAKKILLCFDNDRAGQDGVKRFAEKVGAAKCHRIYPKLKDLNEYAQIGLPKTEVDKVFDDVHPLFSAPVLDIGQFRADAIRVMRESKQYSTGWKKFDEHIGSVRLGELTVISGTTGHGKTTISMALIANLIRQKVKCLVMSPEMSEGFLLYELTKNYSKKANPSEEDIDMFLEECGEYIKLARIYDTWTDRSKESLLDKTFDLIRYSVDNEGVKFVLLDHLRLFLDMKGSDSERFAIDEFTKRCVREATENKIHIWLVAQPKHPDPQQRKITMHNLKGSANIGQDAHNIVLIHRDMSNSGTVEIEVSKVRHHDGNCGTFTLEFDVETKSNYYEEVNN